MNSMEQQLAEWWCQLNRKQFDGFREGQSDPIGPMKFIEHIIGMKRCLEEWNKDQSLRSHFPEIYGGKKK